MSASIHSLYTYPVKSCAGVRHDHIAITHAGLAGDRQWMLVDDTGTFMTQRQHPRMVLIQPQPQADGLWLKAPDMPDCFVAAGTAGDAPPVPVTVWGTATQGADQGDNVARWLSTFLGVSCRLLQVHPQAHRLASPAHVQGWADKHPEDAAAFLPLTHHQFGFADGFPFLVCNQASLDELNQQLQADGHLPAEMIRFRPNIVLQGLEPYDEDHLASLRVGDIQFAFVKACARCPIPNVDPHTGQTAAQPGQTLAHHRQFEQGVLFGVNAVVALPEDVRQLQTGMAVEAEFDF